MNKKSILISSLLIAGVLSTGAISYAYALFTKPAENVTFGISQATDYYLKGTFNSWAQDNNYKFVNNTAGMTAEENKIKEYKLENIPLSKDDEFKIWSNADVWYKDGADDCVYEHHWSNAINYSEDDDHNYKVPMTSNTYSIYLKFYSDGSSKVYVTANKDVLYFIPSTNWKGDSATFAIEQYDGEDNKVNTITTSVENPSGTFKFEVGTTYTKYKFARRNPGNDTTWNASNIQTISNDDTNNCFALWNEYWGGGQVWSDWNAASGTQTGVSCGEWSSK